ncbi:MAG: protein kinase [Acidobacteria bacterium]|nr:protein kinase [Acidobacteriota bacterium]
MTVPPASSVDLQAIRRRLGTRAIGLDLAEAFGRWQTEGHTGDEHAFLQWVLAAQAEEQVMVTAVLPPRFTGSPAPTVSTDATLVAAATLVGDATVISGAPRAPAESLPHPHPTDAAAHPRYVILGEAGKGGMAVVHIARDLELIRKVALKRLAGSAAAHEEAQARFLREVQISAQLDHPNIVPVYGLEVGPDGVPAYAMKLVEGQTLEAFLKETRAFHERGDAPDEAHALAARLEHFLKVCDAMAYAHDKGVVHRDLKPANVMLGRHNEIYVMDWGICRVLRLPDSGSGIEGLDDSADADADTHTRVGTVVGTARYMAPEQAQGHNDEISPATDQYALGLMLYEIATLQAPYESGTVVEVLARAARAEVRPVRHAFASGNVPAEIAAIIGRATAAGPADRYRDVRAFANDVRRYLRGDAVEARPDSLWQKTARTVARHRQKVLTGIVGLVALLAVGTAGLLYRHEQALLAAEVREREMLALVDHVTVKGDVLQTRFLELQGEIDALASTAALALQHTTPGDERFYWVEDFDTPARRPADLVQAAGTEHPQSVTYGAWIPAPGANAAQLTPLIRRLVHVRPYRNELFECARVLLGEQAGEGGQADVRGTGIDAFVIGLAAGVTLQLPGHAGLPRVLDPREAPWYRLASGHTGARWGAPYADASSGSANLRVPLSQAIRADDGRELGVTAMLLSLDHIVRNLVGDSPGVGVRATLLLDADHRVVASNGVLNPARPAAGENVTLQPFPDPALIEVLARRDTGYLETSVFGQPDVLAFDTIQPIGWVLVKVTSEGTVAARVGAAR